MSASVANPEPQCPVRIGEPCRLCMAGARGPDDCGLVYLVGSDAELAARLVQLWADAGRTRPAPQPADETQTEDATD